MTDNSSILNIPDVSGAAMTFSVVVLALSFPRFFKKTGWYKSWIRNKTLEKYRTIMKSREPRPLPVAANDGEVIEGTFVDVSPSHSMPAIPQYRFKSIDDITETMSKATELPSQLGADSVLADIRVLDQATGHLNRQLIAAYQRDMVEWKLVAEYYKRNMSERFHAMDTTNKELQVLISEYLERLTELTRRIEMYEALLVEIQGKVDGLLAQLTAMTDDEMALRSALTRVTDRNVERYRHELTDALAGLRFFREQTLDLAGRAVNNTMDTIGVENKDLTSMQRQLDNLTLNSAVSESVKASMQSVVTSFVSRSVTDESFEDKD